MGIARCPRSVTPLVAMLAGCPGHFETARPFLEELLGPVELASPLFAFDRTDYYNDEMGPALQRQFYSFRNLADPGRLVDWKLATNALEVQLKPVLAPSGQPQRPINLDVGYLTGAKLVLASTKDFAHRLYLREGIYAEITLGFRGDAWVAHAFTFPDFKSGIYDDFLKRIRDRHLRKVKEHAREE